MIVEVDRELGKYYLSLLPKWLDAKRGRYEPHITVVRCYKEVPPDLSAWGRYEEQEVDFLYSPEVQQGKVFFWLNVLCKKLEQVRAELGLPITSQYTRPPEGFSKYFHCTIGNCKI